MIYVNFVSDSCWQVIFESARVFSVLTQCTTEDEANRMADAAKRLEAAAAKFGTCGIEQSIIEWHRSLAYLNEEANASKFGTCGIEQRRGERLGQRGRIGLVVHCRGETNSPLTKDAHMPLAFYRGTQAPRKYRHRMPGQELALSDFAALVLTHLTWMAGAAVLAARIYAATSGV